jgi:hypothetical protein
MRVLIFAVFFFSAFAAKAQLPVNEPKPKKASFSLMGSLGVSTDLKAFYLNFGGPALRFESKIPRTGKTSLSCGILAGVYPSLWYHPDWSADKIRPTLGAGFQLFVQKISLIVPFYYVAYPNQTAKWRASFGLAWRF